MARKGDIIVGLDIGTTKTIAIVGEIKDDHEIEVIGIGTSEAQSMHQGVITEIESTVDSIRKAVAEAELMAGVQIRTVYAGIAGHHIRGFNSHGITAVKTQDITHEDIERVMEQANAVAIPIDRQIMHTLPQNYIVDGQEGIRTPIGMSGIRLEAKVHIVTGSIPAAQNIQKVCQKAGLSVAEIVLEPLASATSVLTDDERQLGVALVDIGGGTADLIIYHRGSVQHTSVLPMGGEFITHDIAVGLNTPTVEAEKIKKDYGSAIASVIDTTDTIQVPKVGSGEIKPIQTHVLCDIIEARVEEIITLIHKEIRKTGLEDLLGAGVVLTGGVTNLPDIDRLSEDLIDMPVRCANPHGIVGLVDLIRDPKYATAVGLLLYAASESNAVTINNQSIFSRMVERVKEVFAGLI